MYALTVLVGNLGKDPESRVIPNGSTVCNFNLAVNRQYTAADGQVVKETTWYHISTWNKLAEICGKYLKKGKMVLVTGRMLAPRPYLSTTTNAPGCQLELVADTVKFLSPAEAQAMEDAAPTGTPAEEVIPFGQPETAPATLPY